MTSPGVGTKITDLYRRWRPKDFGEIIGQDEVVHILTHKLEQGNLNHVIILTGSTGIGKTSIARIIARDLGCTPHNLCEINCADVRGIDSVREINDSVPMYPMGGKCRVWILDEIVQLPKTTQQAFLKTLEDVPSHVYFILCTSDTSGLLPTLMGRGLVLDLRSLTREHLLTILNQVWKKAFKEDSSLPTVSESVFKKISSSSRGSAREALNLLECVLCFKEEKDQLNALKGLHDIDKQSDFLARALFKRVDWEVLVEILEKVQTNQIESLRRQVCDYASRVLMNKRKSDRLMAAHIIHNFRYSFEEGGRAALALAVWNCRTQEV